MFSTRVDEGAVAAPLAMKIGLLAGKLKAAALGDKLYDTGPYQGEFYCADDVPPTLERLIAVPNLDGYYEVSGLVREFAGSGAGEAYDTLTVIALGDHPKEVAKQLVRGFTATSVASPLATPEQFLTHSHQYPVRQPWADYLAKARSPGS